VNAPASGPHIESFAVTGTLLAPIYRGVTAAEALEQHGFTGEQLLKLSRKAAQDALRKRIAFLDPDRFEELADYMLEVGVKYAARYEPGHGIGISTFLYRRMRIRYVDWMRITLGDSRARCGSRRFPSGVCFPFDELRDTAVTENGYDELETPFDAAAEIADDLDPASAWSIVHLAGPIASGWKLTEAATAAGVTDMLAKRRLDDLQDELGHRLTAPVDWPPERWTRPASGGRPRKVPAEVDERLSTAGVSES
jgi:hypothetical protein